MSKKRSTMIPSVRKSSKEDPRISYDRQMRAMRAWADENGVELAPEEYEPGVSGSKPWQERGIGRAIARCIAGEADGVIVEEQSRLSRENGFKTGEVLLALDDANLRLVCVVDGIDTANGGHDAQELNLGMRALLAREQWKQYARRLDHAKRQAVERGVHISGTVPFGYVRPKVEHGPALPLELDEPKASAVRLAFEMRAAGRSFDAIGTELDQRFPGGPSGAGAWATASVRQLLRNRAYLGEARQGKYVQPDAHPALVDVATFDTVQALFRRKEPRTAPPSTKSLLAGLAFCGSCGYALDRQRLYGERNRAQFQYRCRRKHATGTCPAPATVTLERLDEYVLEQLRERLAGLELERRPALVDVERLHARLAAARAKLEPFRDADYVASIGGLVVAQPAVDKVNAEIDELERELADAVPGDDVGRAERRELVARFDELALAERREVIAAELESVTVSPGGRGSRWSPIADRVLLRWHGDPAPAST